MQAGSEAVSRDSAGTVVATVGAVTTAGLKSKEGSSF